VFDLVAKSNIFQHIGFYLQKLWTELINYANKKSAQKANQ